VKNKSGLQIVKIVMWLGLYLERMLSKDKDLFQTERMDLKNTFAPIRRKS
jgi:hypothetical protein